MANTATVRIQLVNADVPVEVHEEYEGGTSFVGDLYDTKTYIENKVYGKKRILICAMPKNRLESKDE